MSTLAIPALGQLWPNQGGIYAGLCRGLAGEPDYHLILATGKPRGRMTWGAGMAWAAKLKVDGCKDFSSHPR